MSVRPVKQLIIGMVATVTILVSTSAPALAATDQEAFAAAQGGIEYLAQNQAPDGSVTGFGGETEWSVVAIAAGGQDPAQFKQDAGASATQFLENSQLPDTAPATDIERKVLAIAAAGEDATSFGGVNHTAKLQSKHVGGQIGDPILLNDDIFGVIAIDAAKKSALHDMAQDGLDYFLAHQQTDGGFSYTTDTCAFCGADSNDTAAAIIAMYAAENMGLSNVNLASSKDKAIVYLLATQQADGGFAYDVFSPSDGSSTAWALMALNVIGSSVQTQAQAARDWLLANQNSDGGFSYGAFGFVDSSTSITAHAVTALLGSSWLLRPQPINFATTNPPVSSGTEQTAQTTRAQTSSIQTAAAVNNTAQTPQIALAQTQTEPEVTSSTPAQTKAAQTTKDASPAPKKKTDSQPNYALYGLPVLLFAGLGWYVLQSRHKQEV